jgi:hypothetical protein
MSAEVPQSAAAPAEAAPAGIPLAPARRLAVWLMVATALLTAVAAAADLLTNNASGGPAFDAPIDVAGTVLWLILAQANRRAISRWPRILAAFFATCYCLGTLWFLADPGRFALSAGSAVVRMLTTVIELAMVVLLLGELRPWMRRLFRAGPP